MQVVGVVLVEAVRCVVVGGAVIQGMRNGPSTSSPVVAITQARAADRRRSLP
jgi:hypothetical protein